MSCSLSNVYTDDGTPVSVKTANHSPFILLYRYVSLSDWYYEKILHPSDELWREYRCWCAPVHQFLKRMVLRWHSCRWCSITLTGELNKRILSERIPSSNMVLTTATSSSVANLSSDWKLKSFMYHISSPTATSRSWNYTVVCCSCIGLCQFTVQAIVKILRHKLPDLNWLT